MRSKLFLLVLLLSSILVFSAVSASAQSEDTDTNYGSEDTYTVDAPILGWYLIPVLGAMRRQRHELNDRAYDEQSPVDEDTISYIE